MPAPRVHNVDDLPIPIAAGGRLTHDRPEIDA
jgi:hypothetical protein